MTVSDAQRSLSALKEAKKNLYEVACNLAFYRLWGMKSAKGQIRRTIFANVRQRALQADVEHVLSVSVQRFSLEIVVIAVKIAVSSLYFQ